MSTCTDRGVVFIHIPKTGGTSIKKMFGILRATNAFIAPWQDCLLQLSRAPLQYHFTWLDLKRNLSSEFLTKAYKFAFVRNPWDRFVSEFFWRRRWYVRKNPALTRDYHYRLEHLSSLDAFVRVLELPEEKRIDPCNGFDGHVEPQLTFVVDERRRIVLDFLGRFESFEADLKKIAAETGVLLKDVSHMMKSARQPDYRPYYSSYARSAVKAFYKDDISEFDYRF